MVLTAEVTPLQIDSEVKLSKCVDNSLELPTLNRIRIKSE